MESPFRFIFAPIGFILFFAFLVVGLLFGGLSLAIGAFGYVKGQMASSVRAFLFS
jgi:type III secretory pathway component EscR